MTVTVTVSRVPEAMNSPTGIMVIGGLANPTGDEFGDGVGAGVGDGEDAGKESGVWDAVPCLDEDVLVG